MKRTFPPLWILSVLAALVACGQGVTQPENASFLPGDKLKVVATTTLVGDVVRQIGGETLDLTVLLPVGADPHSFQPTPGDLAKVTTAQAIFISGAGLETFVQPLLKNSGSQARLVSVSDGIPLLEPPISMEHAAGDPHVWMDPNNVSVWTQNIEKTLVEMQPANASIYQANAQAYRRALTELDQWVRQQVALIPPDNRKLVTDHQVFGYFASRYGFQQVGAVIPGYSSMAEPSAQELAALEEAIRSLSVRAAFVGNTVNPSLAERVAEDTGVPLVMVYTDSLTAPDGPAATYLDFLRYNVNAIVSALK